MKRSFPVMIVAGVCLFLAAPCVALSTQPAATRPGAPGQISLDQLFMPLRVAMQRRDELGLSDDQMQTIRDLAQKMLQDTSVAQADLENQTAALADMMRQDKPDMQKMTALLDKALNDQRVIQRARMTMALSVLDQLTPDQLDKVHQIMDRIAAAGPPPPMLRAKFEEVLNALRQARESGQDMQDVHQVFGHAQQAMDEGQYKQAEEKIDQALKMLGDNGTDKK